MAEYKRQHYVPQFYLRAFAGSDPEQTNLVVLAQAKAVSGAKIKTQCYEDYFYGADLKMEKALCEHIESPASKIISNVVTSGILPKVGTEDYAMLIAFVMFQHGRTVYASEELAEMTEEMGRLLIEKHLVATGKATAESVKDAKLQIHMPVIMAIRMNAQMLPLVLDLRAKLLVNTTKEDFITSDNPVALANPYYKESYPGSVTGWVVKGLQVFLPLSPRLTLCIYDAGTYKFGTRKAERVEIVAPADVDWLNGAQLLNAVDCVYFSNPQQAHRILLLWDALKSRRRQQKVKVNEIPDESGALVHTHKHDLDLRGALSVCRLHNECRGVAVEHRAYAARKPETVAVFDAFWQAVREKHYKAHEFPKFVEDMRTARKDAR